MVVFRPFRGWKYNPDVVGDLANVVSPPYDLITPEIQESLRQRSPYNVVHLEAGEGLDWTAPGGNFYRDTGELFEEWLRRRVLKRDAEPCFYLLRHNFVFQGQHRTRIGLTGCIGLEQYDRRQVFPHEYTEEPAILDRVSLMSACNANFSPIMSLYRDTARFLGSTFQETMKGEPVIQVQADADQQLSLWLISDRDQIDRIQRFFNDTPVFLADGHHRYEAALRFQELQQRPGQNPLVVDDSYNFVMMTLIEFDDPGLMVLPYHRVVRGMAGPTLDQFQERLRQLFEVQSVELPSHDTAGRLLEEVIRRSDTGRALGLIGPEPNAAHLLTLKDGVDWEKWGPLAASEAWILEEQVLKPVLGEQLAGLVDFIHDHDLALEQVSSGGYQMAFLIRPFPMNQFEDIVSQGQRLPRKSTFFYPKLPAGLVINQLDGAL